MQSFTPAQLARVAACALTAAEDEALFSTDEKIWALWQIEAARLAQLDLEVEVEVVEAAAATSGQAQEAEAAVAAASQARRDLAPAFILCLATIYEGPWLACLE